MEIEAQTKKLIYLAHPLSSRHHMRKWELEMEDKYQVNIINPFYDLTFENVKKLDEGMELKEWMGQSSDELVLDDIHVISGCDALIALIDGSTSYGTIMEIAYAHALGIKVYAVVTNGYENHPWLMYHCDEIYIDLEDLEEVFNNGTI